ncbi:MAG: 50S ribosomal protein L30 [bacterium]|nr:50S ribosomal protein L30 [bacterium]
MAQIKITLKRSAIGKPKKHKQIIEGLGLRKTNPSVVLKETPQIWGMINKIPHIVDVEKVSD